MNILKLFVLSISLCIGINSLHAKFKVASIINLDDKTYTMQGFTSFFDLKKWGASIEIPPLCTMKTDVEIKEFFLYPEDKSKNNKPCNLGGLVFKSNDQKIYEVMFRKYALDLDNVLYLTQKSANKEGKIVKSSLELVIYIKNGKVTVEDTSRNILS